MEVDNDQSISKTSCVPAAAMISVDTRLSSRGRPRWAEHGSPACPMGFSLLYTIQVPLYLLKRGFSQRLNFSGAAKLPEAQVEEAPSKLPRNGVPWWMMVDGFLKKRTIAGSKNRLQELTMLLESLSVRSFLQDPEMIGATRNLRP